MELVSPAGNIEKLKYAYLFGADAAYIGIKDFSLRTKAENLRENEHQIIRKIKGKKRLYCALNIYFHNQDLDRLYGELDYIALYPFDAFIVSDLGLVPILRRRFPDLALHLSTQANCVNTEAARIYRDLGFSRIIPGREMSLSEIEHLKNKTGIEIEVFVHGAMCLAYSGRCFLSSYLAHRSANRGNCAHACRWRYRALEESERRGEYLPIVEGENFTTIMSSKDLCMIDHLDKLKSAGIDSIKIEGRMKSTYYTAVVTRAYRNAIDRLHGNAVDASFRDELLKVSHREFSTGFYFDRDVVEKPTQTSYICDYLFVGIIGKETAPGTYQLDVKNQIKEGDILEYVGYDLPTIRDERFKLIDQEGFPLKKTDHGHACSIVTDKKVKEGYLVRKRIAEWQEQLL